MSGGTAAEIERRLRERLNPVVLELVDDSAKHVGHRGATSGGGHYQLVVVSSAFEGKSSIDRHRLVHEILAGMFGERIHALTMRTLTPDQWEAGGT
jgi:BolA protein